MRSLIFGLLLTAAHALGGNIAAADCDCDQTVRLRCDPKVQQLHPAIAQGCAFATRGQWATALQQFMAVDASLSGGADGSSAAAGLSDARLTFNIAVCANEAHRHSLALVAARRALQLPELHSDPSLEAEIGELIGSAETNVAYLVLHVEPRGAPIRFDGLPLRKVVWPESAVYVAGLEPHGSANPKDDQSVSILTDPGKHQVEVVLRGYREFKKEYVVSSSQPTVAEVALEAESIDLSVASKPDGAAVAIDSIAVGTTPITLPKPAGEYNVRVELDGYESYEQEVVLPVGGPGRRVDAALRPTPAWTEHWLFWTGLAVIGAAAGVTAYLVISDPDPEPKPYSGGGLDWVVAIP